MHCNLCNSDYQLTLTLKQIFSFQAVPTPSMCEQCYGSFNWLASQTCCDICNRLMKEKGICTDCRSWQQIYPGQNIKHIALIEYDESAKNYFKQYKLIGDYVLRNVFSEYIGSILKKNRYDLFIPIPPDLTRYAQRGFDPVKGLFENSGLLTTMLVKKESTLSQSKRTRKERIETNQPFSLIHQTESFKDAKKILIIDDIYTTGRTIFHVRDCLIEQGFQGEIHSFSIAR